MDTFIVAPYIGLNMIGLLLDDTSEKFHFTTMAQLAIFAGLRDVIDMVYDNGVTFLVPPNRRFIRGEFDVPELFTEASRQYTHSLVSSHLILHTNYYESSVFSLHEQNNILETLEVSYLGTSMWITTTDDRLRFQGVDVLMPDQVSRNGYVFVVLPHDTITHTQKSRNHFTVYDSRSHSPQAFVIYFLSFFSLHCTFSDNNNNNK
jgi:Fasciclin domain